MKDLKKLVSAAVFAALICIGTIVIRIPTVTGGFINMGDAVILTGAYLLGPVYGGAAAGLGSMIADILSGYAAFAAGTLVIKALTALTAWSVYRTSRLKAWGIIPAGIAAELVMTAGYTFYEGVILGLGAGAFAGIPANLIQGLFGVIVSSFLFGILKKAIPHTDNK